MNILYFEFSLFKFLANNYPGQCIPHNAADVNQSDASPGEKKYGTSSDSEV
jgi:hypothetical protein